MEKEQYQTEIRDLQDQLSEMHDELDGAKQSQTDSTDKEAMMEVQGQIILKKQNHCQKICISTYHPKVWGRYDFF